MRATVCFSLRLKLCKDRNLCVPARVCVCVCVCVWLACVCVCVSVCLSVPLFIRLFVCFCFCCFFFSLHLQTSCQVLWTWCLAHGRPHQKHSHTFTVPFWPFNPSRLSSLPRCTSLNRVSPAHVRLHNDSQGSSLAVMIPPKNTAHKEKGKGVARPLAHQLTHSLACVVCALVPCSTALAVTTAKGNAPSARADAIGTARCCLTGVFACNRRGRNENGEMKARKLLLPCCTPLSPPHIPLSPTRCFTHLQPSQACAESPRHPAAAMSHAAVLLTSCMCVCLCLCQAQ